MNVANTTTSIVKIVQKPVKNVLMRVKPIWHNQNNRFPFLTKWESIILKNNPKNQNI